MKYPIKEREKKFFLRTFSLVEKYKKLEKELEYEVTFLINCLYGIIIVAQSNFYSKLDFRFEKNIEGVIYKKNKKEFEIKNIQLKSLLTVLRNSLAHFGDRRKGEKFGRDNIQLKSTISNEIGEIKFENKSKNVEIIFKSSDTLYSFIRELKKSFEKNQILI